MISWQTDRQTDSYDTVGLQFWLMYVFYHWTFFHKIQTGSSVSKSTQIKLSSHSGFAPLFFSRLVFALDETDPILRSSSHLQSSNWLSCCCNQQNSRHQPPHQTFLNHNIFFFKIGVVSSKVSATRLENSTMGSILPLLAGGYRNYFLPVAADGHSPNSLTQLMQKSQ